MKELSRLESLVCRMAGNIAAGLVSDPDNDVEIAVNIVCEVGERDIEARRKP